MHEKVEYQEEIGYEEAEGWTHSDGQKEWKNEKYQTKAKKVAILRFVGIPEGIKDGFQPIRVAVSVENLRKQQKQWKRNDV